MWKPRTKDLVQMAAGSMLALLTGCGERPATNQGHEAMEAAEMQSPAREAGLEVDARKQQMIGVTYGEVRRSSVEQTIRTVGTVAYDESALTDVTLKFHGWIEGLRVDRMGDYVREGEILFSLYSPELVQTQEDYLTSFEHLQRLGRSPRAAEASRRMEDLLAAVRRRLDYWDVPENHVRDLEQDRRILRSLPIHSPAGGYVIEKHVTEGAHVQAGHLLYRLADLDAVWVLADVYEHELPRVAPGQEARVTLSYLPGETFVGKVGYVYPYLDPKERTVKVRIELANPGHRLRAGMYADVELRAEPREVLVVPAAAVLDSGERRVVFVAAGPGRFEPREIESGARFDDAVEVLAGLEVGERIVTSANFLLDSESQLASGMRQMSH